MTLKGLFMAHVIALAVVGCAIVSTIQDDDKSVFVNYITEPCLIPTKDDKFRLCDSMIVKIDSHYHAVPHGFKTDLASIPRVLWPLFSPNEYDTIAPAVLHDWHYCCVAQVDRQRADHIFYESLVLKGMSPYKAYIYWTAVRLFGSSSYKHGEGIKDHLNEFDKKELQGVYEDVDY